VPGATAAPVGVADADKGSDGVALVANDYIGPGLQAAKQGLWALERADLFNLLCITPPDRGDSDTDPSVYVEALAYCVSRRAVLVVDPPHDMTVAAASAALDALGLSGDGARNASIYFPRVQEADLLSGGQSDTFVPCGIVAGVMARTDAERGVWKAPAGLDASLRGTQALAETITDGESGALNQLGINALRSFPVVGRVVWGARTLRGADILADEYKYLPVRRLALLIEESLFRGTQWVVFEPNDEPLWAQIRLNAGAFMQGLFRQGAFKGTTPREAYFVKCDKETTTQNDIDLGRVNILVGFAPLKPAEFVIIQIQQMAGQVQA
jgi:phage tail sheath protein FI